MKLGLFSMNMGVRREPDGLVATAQAAEAAGFDSVWAGEHVVLPDPQVPPSPMPPRDPALDPLLALTWAAAATASVKLATGIVILPQRKAFAEAGMGWSCPARKRMAPPGQSRAPGIRWTDCRAVVGQQPQ